MMDRFTKNRHSKNRFTTPSSVQVKELYTVHPYPRYPLLARPRWTAGYSSSLPWIQTQYGKAGDQKPLKILPEKNNSDQKLFLAVGCGEILPSVLSAWLPRNTTCIGLDLSKTSLLRALWRPWLTKPLSLLLEWVSSPLSKNHLVKIFDLKQSLQAMGSRCTTKIVLTQGDMMDFLDTCQPEAFDHIDAFGVIHHMPSPRSALGHMAKALKPGGTLRLMVYNSKARGWIREIQRLLELLKCDFRSSQDIGLARCLVLALGDANPQLKQQLTQMGMVTIQNNARFADTFLHPREARIDLKLWYQWFNEVGFSVLGLFDRYGELDHLQNPLWIPPHQESLSKEIDSQSFAGNLEFYLVKGSLTENPTKARPQSSLYKGRSTIVPRSGLSHIHCAKIFLNGPPRFWFTFPETARLKALERLQIWYHFVSQLASPSSTKSGPWPKLPLPAVQRLARLGAINPHVITPGQWGAYLAPITVQEETIHIAPRPRQSLKQDIPPQIQMIIKSLSTKLTQKKLHLVKLRILRLINT